MAGENRETRTESLGRRPEDHVVGRAHAAIAGLVTWMWPEISSIVSLCWCSWLRILLLVIGIPMLVVAGKAATIAYHLDKPATTGIFGIVRNPIYSAWIVFITARVCAIQPFLAPISNALIVFKIRIRREYEYLEKRVLFWRRLPERRG